MSDDCLSATTVIDATAPAVFAVLTDPARHAAIDGTGWVRDTASGESLKAAGQIFRMLMYHADHPDRDYETANRVEVFDPPRAISWKTGYEDDGVLYLGNWYWRYDLTPIGAMRTSVTLTYDWSETSASVRELIGFPPFPSQHLVRSLDHLAGLVAGS